MVKRNLRLWFYLSFQISVSRFQTISDSNRGKQNSRLAGGRLYGKQLFTWLSLVVSLMASFVLSFFPLDVVGEIRDLIESVSEGFLTYSSIRDFQNLLVQNRV